MSTQVQSNTWAPAAPIFVPTARQTWIARRRITFSLIGFSLLVGYNVFIRQAVPHNPLSLGQPIVVASLSLMMLGLAIRTWAAGTLNKSRELTTVGPYSIIRNPLYAGSYLIMLSFCLLCRDWPTLLFVSGPLMLLYWLQVLVEEERLYRFFSNQWLAYAASTPRLIPRRIPHQPFVGWSAFEWIRNREYNAIGASFLGLLSICIWHWIRTG